jgi:hypothetical protein
MTTTAAKLTAGNRNATKTSSNNKDIRFPRKLLFRKNLIKDESNTVQKDAAISSPARNLFKDESNTVEEYTAISSQARSLFDLLEVQCMATPPACTSKDGIDEQCRDKTEDFFIKFGSMAGADEQARQVDDYSVVAEFVKNSNNIVVPIMPPEPAE